MKVLVDTSVWSLALRRDRPTEERLIKVLGELIDEQRVIMIGPIRQELLSGIRDSKQFERLKQHLSAFPDLSLTQADFETAAEFYNRCRAKGIQGSNTDFLICAVAVNYQLAILTTDTDFTHFSAQIPVQLLSVSSL